MLFVALVLLHVEPKHSWKPPDSSHPTWRILQLLLVSVGLPYFALSATGPLLQAWFSRAYPGRSPYRLYALSNVGSLLALLSYPFVFEPAFDVLKQIDLWSVGFWLFVALCGACAIWIARRHWSPGELDCEISAVPGVGIAAAVVEEVPSVLRRALWLGLPACASLMLLATTNHVCQDVAVIPFLWVVPLSLYLLTFIICFDHERWYVRPVFCGLTIALLMGVVGLPELESFFNSAPQGEKNYIFELSIYFTAMFCVCMVCHGELVRLRPGHHYLTEFYLLISAGGALGGIFVSLIAPSIFHTFFEWKIALTASHVLAVVVLAWSFSKWTQMRPAWVMAAALPLGLACPALTTWLDWDDEQPAAIKRNFYGVVSVWDIRSDDDPEMNYFSLLNGHIVHGRQFTDPDKSRLPISYYPFYSGVGQAVTYYQDRRNLKVGTIGLGVGTLAAYARPGDQYRFYEINPTVLEMANQYFTYLKDCRGQQDVVLGDARLTLEREPPQGFHVLVLDAFSGDAIPTHLLTREAFEIYLKHLDPAGILAINITNKYLDLAPVVHGLADHFHLGTTQIDVPEDEEKLINRSHWMLVTRDKNFLQSHPPQLSEEPTGKRREVHLWTDHYSNLFEILY